MDCLPRPSARCGPIKDRVESREGIKVRFQICQPPAVGKATALPVG